MQPSAISNSRTFPSPQKETLQPLAVTPHSVFPLSALCNSNLLFVSMHLPILGNSDKRISYYWVFCDWLLSLSTIFLSFMCISISLFFIAASPMCAYTTFYLSIHQLVDILRYIHFLAILNNTAVNTVDKRSQNLNLSLSNSVVCTRLSLILCICSNRKWDITIGRVLRNWFSNLNQASFI